MAYLFHQDALPRLLSTTPGRERVFFVSKELAGTDSLLAGIMYYDDDAASPYHLHENCEHFYLIFEGEATFESKDGRIDLQPGDLVYIPPEEEHRLSAKTALVYFELQAPNRFKTKILDAGSDADLLWKRVDGNLWVQS